MTRTIPDMSSVPRSVAVAATDGMLHFELALAYEVFGSAPAALPGPWYDVKVCGTHAVRVDLHPGIARGQFIGVCPVRGRV